jgi:hypothetical protein
MILMVLNYILCMTLMVFIYVYYGVFIYTNLVDVMLFFTVFSFYLPIFDKNRPVSAKLRPKITTPILKKISDLSVKLAEFRYSQFSLFLRRLRCVSTKFSQILPIFPKFFKNRRNCSGLVFLLRLNFRTLVVPRRVRRCLGRREELKKAGQAVATTASASAAATPESAK